MEAIIVFWFCSFCLHYQVQKKNSWLFRLTNSVTLVQLKMLHACTKKQISSVCGWCMYLVGGYVVLKEKIVQTFLEAYKVYSSFIRLVTLSLHVFSGSKMTVFQTYNKKYGIFNVVIWIEILQPHRYNITVITWLYLKKKKDNFQSM